MKTKEQIQEVLDAVQDELQNLPDVDVFGESNEEDKAESTLLEKALKDKPCSNTEVQRWLNGESSELRDYE